MEGALIWRLDRIYLWFERRGQRPSWVGLGKKAEFKMRGWVMMIVEKVWKMIKERMLLMRKSGGGIKRQA